MYQHQGYISVDLAALGKNWHYLNRHMHGGECGAVVKADAYGLGVGPVAEHLWAEGCRSFFVATYKEAMQLRPLLPEADLYVLQGCPAGLEQNFVQQRFIPLLITLPMAHRWAAQVAGLPGVRAGIKVNTGMNRLGLDLPEFLALCQQPKLLRDMGLTLLVSHLACADEPEHPMNRSQLQQFLTALTAVRAHLPAIRASLANSGGILLGKEWLFDLARPGIALYGGSPVLGQADIMNPVVAVHLPVLQVRTIPAGAAVGYGGDYRATEQRCTAVVAGGYGDGLLRALASGAQAWFGQPLPMLGRVSMDSCVFDITHLSPEARPVEGDYLELLGEHRRIDQMAQIAGTISYEILTRLGGRLQRRYASEADI